MTCECGHEAEAHAPNENDKLGYEPCRLCDCYDFQKQMTSDEKFRLDVIEDQFEESEND